MSTNSGMMAHVSARPGTLNQALDNLMLKADPASPIAEQSTAPPVTPPVPPPAPTRVLPPRRRTEQGSVGVVAELTALTKRERVKKPLNVRIDHWVDEAIRDVMRNLDAAGHRDITKERLVTVSIIRGLNLTPPEGWEPM